ncbi:hypothetical protein P3L10_028230 [Capsicum annuum]
MNKNQKLGHIDFLFLARFSFSDPLSACIKVQVFKMARFEFVNLEGPHCGMDSMPTRAPVETFKLQVPASPTG